MSDHPQKEEKPFMFQLAESCLPEDESKTEEEPMSNRHFLIGLFVAFLLVIFSSMLLRGCFL